MTSTAGLRQAGAKKWVTVARPGCFSSAKMRAAGSELVLEVIKRVRSHDALYLGEDAPLQRHVFRRRLDDPVAVGELGVVRRAADVGDDGGCLRLAHLALGDGLLRVVLAALQGLVDGGLIDVDQGQADLRQGALQVVADVGADGAGADDGDVLRQGAGGRLQEGIGGGHGRKAA
jgi:hypothetical protein